MSIESASSEQAQVLVPRKNLLHLAERLEADGDEHGVAACLRQLTADTLTVAPPSGLSAQHVAMLIPMRDDCRSHRLRPETDALNAAIELLSAASLDAEFSAHHAGDGKDVVREYIEARDAYEAATKPLNSHAPLRSLPHGDPVMLRYQAARAALAASLSEPPLSHVSAQADGSSAPTGWVDALAQEIRRVDGAHTLGASALAEALMPFLSATQQPAVDPFAAKLTLDGLIQYGRTAGTPWQGAVRSHLVSLVAQMVPHLERLQAGAPTGVSNGLIQKLWEASCVDSAGAPGWSRHLRFARELLALAQQPRPAPTLWQSIEDLSDSDDLFWFLRWDSAGGFTEDGPRAPQPAGHDSEEWQWFAPAKSPPPPYMRTFLEGADQGRVE